MSGCHRDFKLECNESLLVLYGPLCDKLASYCFERFKVLLTETNFVTYIKARSEKVRLSWYCEDGNKTQLFTVLLKMNVLGKRV